MTEVNKLNDILDYIDIGITDNNNKSHYILYISMIHDLFELEWDRFWNTIQYTQTK